MFELRFSSETDSTNDDAAKLLGEPGSAGVVLVTDFQRAGRARHDRNWVAPPGSSLLFTTILPQPVTTASLWALPFWTALGVADGIEAAAALRVDLQWPNDLLLDGHKCCGILCVSRVNGERAWVGCGVGLNVLRPMADATLSTLDPPPAFLSDRAPEVMRQPLLRAILRAFERLLGDLDEPEAIARLWERRAALDGTPYRLLIDGETGPVEAVARRIASGGALVVEHGGRERSVALADARVLR